MSQLEYLIALISIIVGLGLTDLAQSLRELVRPGSTVQWHWLPLLWAANVFLIIVQLWWASFNILQRAVFGRALVFLPFLLLFVGLYLACAFSLPDLEERTSAASPASPTGELDLEQFYFSPAHRRWFFGILIGITILGQGIVLPLFLLQAEVGLGSAVLTVSQNVVIAGLFAVLIVTERRWVHAGVAILLFGGLVYSLAASVPTIG